MFKNVSFAVDVTECPIARPNNPTLEYFLWSRKAHACTFKYQGMREQERLFLSKFILTRTTVVTHVASGRILRIDGGSPKKHDKKIYDESGLADSLLPNELGVADKGYEGARKLLTPYKGWKLTEDQVTWNKNLSSVRMLTERTNGLIKKFNAFMHRWRGDYHLHQRAFMFIAHMVNVQIELHPIQRTLNSLLGPAEEDEFLE